MKHTSTVTKPTRILRIKEVLHLRGLPKSTFYDHIKNGLMTSPISLGGERSVGWPSSEIEEINQALIAGATTEQLKQLVIDLTQQRQQAA